MTGPSFARPLKVFASTTPSPVLMRIVENAEYREMEHAFRASGGIGNSDGMTLLLRRHTDQPISRLARWIVDHDVLTFERNGCTLLPLFQFEPSDMTVRRPVRDVVRELLPILGGWETSLWFARGNGWLANAKPVDVIVHDARAVHNAARADGYLVR